MESKKYKALAFDFDGTLFDTAELNYKAYHLAYFDLGVEITPEMFARTKGLSVYEFNRAMGVDCDVEELRRLKARYYRTMSVYARPNSYLLYMIREARIPVALVTTARLTNILPLLQKYDLEGAFAVIVTQEDVEKHKPDPEAYNLAIKKLGIRAEDVLAFEDSRAGFVSARSAGLDCVQIRDFSSNCIVDMSGGSESRTELLWNYTERSLYVKKTSFTQQATKRLKNQFEFLQMMDGVGGYVTVKDWGFGETRGRYSMPYIIGPNLYQYQNKIGVLEGVIDKLVESDLMDDYPLRNEVDVAEECWKNYIEPGMVIYRHVGGQGKLLGEGEYRFFAQTIDEDVIRDFRLTRYHGDATFENIIMSRTDGPVFIDPVPDGNVIHGIVHDFAKLGQSLYGYEAIRDGIAVDYAVEREIFQTAAKKHLLESEFKSLKFHIACLYLRRLKHQIYQNPALVIPYGDLALRLLREFQDGNYEIA